MRDPRLWRVLRGMIAAFIVAGGVGWLALSRAWPDTPIHVHVRWQAGIADTQRANLERRFRLEGGRRQQGDSWEYLLADTSTANIAALVQDSRVGDTAHLNRVRYRPEFAQDRMRQRLAYALAIGSAGAVLWLLFALLAPAAAFRLSWTEFTAALAPASARAAIAPSSSSPRAAASPWQRWRRVRVLLRLRPREPSSSCTSAATSSAPSSSTPSTRCRWPSSARSPGFC